MWTGRSRAGWAWWAAALLAAAVALVWILAAWILTARWADGMALLAVGAVTQGFTAVRVRVAARARSATARSTCG